MRKITIGKYERITKATAKKLYISGETIALTPCKCNPDNKLFSFTSIVNIKDRNTGANVSKEHAANDFTNLVNAFEFYNCNYSELGKYTAFYRIAE